MYNEHRRNVRALSVRREHKRGVSAAITPCTAPPTQPEGKRFGLAEGGTNQGGNVVSTEASEVEPIQADFAETVGAAVAQRERAEQITARLVQDRDPDTVWFVGCGGSLYASCPVQYLLETSTARLSAVRMTSNEFNFRRPARLSERSIVVVASHSGRTEETLAAIETARRAHAAVLGVTRAPDSPLAEQVDDVFTYGSEDTVWEPKQVLLANVGHGLLQATGFPPDPAVRSSYAALPDALLASLAAAEPQLHDIAVRLQYEPVIYVLGSGPVEGVAGCLAMCYLQEMQWMHAAAFNAGEFVHGAFEVVTDDVAVIVYAGEDATRPMAERVISFLKRYTKKLVIVDARDLTLPGVAAAARSEIAPIALGSTVSRLAKHFAAVRGHDLELRRYMSKVEY